MRFYGYWPKGAIEGQIGKNEPRAISKFGVSNSFGNEFQMKFWSLI